MQNKQIKIHIIPLILSFIAGIFYVYINSPKPRLIIKYPTPYNSGKYTYKSLSGECYKFKSKQVECNKEAIDQPIV